MVYAGDNQNRNGSTNGVKQACGQCEHGATLMITVPIRPVSTGCDSPQVDSKPSYLEIGTMHAVPI